VVVLMVFRFVGGFVVCNLYVRVAFYFGLGLFRGVVVVAFYFE